MVLTSGLAELQIVEQQTENTTLRTRILRKDAELEAEKLCSARRHAKVEQTTAAKERLLLQVEIYWQETIVRGAQAPPPYTVNRGMYEVPLSRINS